MKLSSVFGGISGALANRDYRRFWASNFLSTLGRWFYRMAVGWLTWELTESPAWLGAIAFADTFPMVVFSILAGALSDRIGCVVVMRVSQFFLCAVVGAFAALTLAGVIDIWMVLGLATLFGIMEAASTPARAAVVHSLVGKDDLPSAIALGSATFNACRVLGPMLAGALILWIDIGTVLAIASVALFQLLIVLFVIPGDTGTSGSKSSRSLLGDVRDGVVYTMQHPGIRYMMILLVGTGLFIRPFMDMLPGFSAEVFGRGPEGLALMLSSIGAGAIVACLWLARRGSTKGLTAHVTHALAISGLALMWFTVAGHIWIGAAILTVVGYFMLIGGVGAQTLIQSTVESRMRARVLSIYIVISWGLPALGAIAIGWVATFFGLQPTVAAFAAVTLLMWLWARPAGRRLASELEQPDAVAPAAGKAG